MDFCDVCGSDENEDELLVCENCVTSLSEAQGLADGRVSGGADDATSPRATWFPPPPIPRPEAEVLWVGAHVLPRPQAGA